MAAYHHTRNSKIQRMTVIGLMTAILCVISPFSVQLPFSPVPLSPGTLAIYLACMILGCKKGSTCVLLYILLGIMGFPVFSGFTGGAGKLLGPTGGFLLGYLFMAVICGFYAERHHRKFLPCIFGMFIGTVICYCLGCLWLSFQSRLSLSVAFSTAVLPFLPTDLLKMLVAHYLGYHVYNRLRKAGFI